MQPRHLCYGKIEKICENCKMKMKMEQNKAKEIKELKTKQFFILFIITKQARNMK